MSKDLSVHIVYRNAERMPVADALYAIDEYARMLSNDLLKLITDVEDCIYAATDGQSKEDWNDNTFVRFCKVKHKLLDKAGEISRLPENIVRGGVGNGEDSECPKTGHGDRGADQP